MGLAVVCILTIAYHMFKIIERFDIDNYVSGYFYNGHGFYLNHSRVSLYVRDISRSAITHVISFGAIWVYISYVCRKPICGLAAHKVLFILWNFVLGSGVTVYLMKTLFARPRPRAIVDFGGDAFFSSAWSLNGTCLRNCSFPSGEGAAALAFLTLLVLVPQAYRWTATALLVPTTLVVSLNRVALGAHFLSDIVAAWLIMAVFITLSWCAFQKYRSQIDSIFTADPKHTDRRKSSCASSAPKKGSSG